MSLEVHIVKKLENFTMRADFTNNGICTGILGASGCGKSMFLKCIAGIETPDEGNIVLDGRVLFDSAKKINLPPQKRNVGYLFQNYALFPSMTVAENIACGINAGKKGKKSKAEVSKIVADMVRLCRLEGLEHQYPQRLSGGQQQRTALARMLAVNPSMIMLDEPFSALDSHLKDAMQKEMAGIIKSYSGNVIMVSHSRDELYRLCENLYVMDRGTFTRNGSVREVFARPENKQAAILTGCKNVAAIERTTSAVFSIPSWGISVKTGTALPDDITHVGIRAHYFYAVDETAPVPENSTVFRAEIAEVDDRPFEYDYYLKTETGTEPFLWKVSKSNPTVYKTGDALTLYVRDEDIMWLRD